MPEISTRERRLLLATVFLVALTVLWLALLRPALDLRQESLDRIANLNVVAGALDRFSPSIQEPSDRPPLRQRVAEAARASELGIQRLDPQGGALAVTLDDVPFVSLIGWIDTLTSDHSARVLSSEIARRPEPGIVTARIVLEDAR